MATGSNDETPNLLCVATLIPRKGHTVLIEALAMLVERNWRLCCVGSIDRHPRTATAVQAMIRKFDLGNRVQLTGEVDDQTLADIYQRADIFVLPSYYEGYGMVLAEAQARGLPIVSTTGGAIPATVSPESALLVPPGDSKALAGALDMLLTSPQHRKQMARTAWMTRYQLPDWPTTGIRFAKQLQLEILSSWPALPATG